MNEKSKAIRSQNFAGTLFICLNNNFNSLAIIVVSNLSNQKSLLIFSVLCFCIFHNIRFVFVFLPVRFSLLNIEWDFSGSFPLY